MRALSIVLLFSLASCAEWQAAVTAAYKEVETDRRNIADDRLTGEIQGLCLTTYADIVRNQGTPGLTTSIPALCGHISAAPAMGVLGEQIKTP